MREGGGSGSGSEVRERGGSRSEVRDGGGSGSWSEVREGGVSGSDLREE